MINDDLFVNSQTRQAQRDYIRYMQRWLRFYSTSSLELKNSDTRDDKIRIATMDVLYNWKEFVEEGETPGRVFISKLLKLLSRGDKPVCSYINGRRLQAWHIHIADLDLSIDELLEGVHKKEKVTRSPLVKLMNKKNKLEAELKKVNEELKEMMRGKA